VRLWDLARLKAWALRGHEDIVCDVAITPDGNHAISTSLDRTIRIWDFGPLRKFQLIRAVAQVKGNTSLSDGAPGGLDAHEAEVAEQQFSKPLVLLGGDHAIYDCVPSPDGNWLVTLNHESSSTATARLWRMNDGMPLSAAPIRLPKRMMPAAALAWISPTQKWFFFATLAKAFEAKADFSTSRNWLLLSGAGKLMLYNALYDRDVPTAILDASGFSWSALSPDDRWLMTARKGDPAGSSELWLCKLNEVDNTNSAAIAIGGPVQQASFSACGQWLISVEAEAVCLRDLGKPDFSKPDIVLPMNGAANQSVCTDLNGQLLFVGGERGFARLWQLTADAGVRPIMELPGHDTQIGGVEGRFSDDGRWLVTADSDALQLWDVAVRERRYQLSWRGAKIRFGFQFSADGRWLIVSRCGQLLLVDLQDTASPPLILREYNAGRVGFTVSADSRWLVTADVPIEKPRGRAPVPSVRISDLWAPNVPESSVELPGLTGGAQRIAISWDSQWLATQSEDGVRLWPLGVAHLVKVATETVGRELTDEERARHLLVRSTAVQE
jgi:WD40 repeat protein